MPSRFLHGSLRGRSHRDLAQLYRADHPHSGTTYRMVRGTITDAAPAMGNRGCDTLAIEEKAPWRSVGAWRTFMRER